ncbi:MAG TPA: TldD/PmbA family protein [Polyangiaceae bacterium]|nr:TldD/PmbA family protein [Polyangiaceae bacterium]
MTQEREERLAGLARDLGRRALAKGADVAEASARGGYELSVKVRLGKPELVEEAGHHSVSLRVIKGGRVAITSTSDLTPHGVERCVEDALELVELSEVDPQAGPADPSELCHPPFPELDLFDPSVAGIGGDEALARALAGERAALDFDPRIVLSEGATFQRSDASSALWLSTGFEGMSRGSYASLSVVPVVSDEGGKKRRGYYWTGARHVEKLEDMAEVGREAARRTLAKLGSRKVPTTEAPVIFDPDVARSLIGSFAGCIMGGAVWRKSTYLLEREGTAVASPLVNITDDPLIPRALGSRGYDGEGLASRRNVVVEAGVLKTFLLDCYSARKLGRRSTASAGRGGGSVGPTTTNFVLAAGTTTPEEILGSTARGLYVTDLLGFGFNPVTGDFSRGAVGFWVENGKLAFPVSEITISSTLDGMLKSIDALGTDLELKSATASPTLRVASMTISGE